MILQALTRYYKRLRENPDSGVAQDGFTTEQISFAVRIDWDGTLLDIIDIRDMAGKKPRAIGLDVPERVTKSVNICANFLWDNTGYVLGADEKGKPERSRQTFEAFRARQHEVGDGVDDNAMKAVLKFLDAWEPNNASELDNWEDIVGSNLVFRVADERRFVHQHPAVIDAWRRANVSPSPENRAMCLVTGKTVPVARLHNKIKGVRDAQTSGASIVSFNLDAFCSYGKEQNYNAPIGEEAAFAYTTALNYLLRFDSTHKIQIGDATTVFWAERDTPIESIFGIILDHRENAADEEAARQVREYLSAIRAGKKPVGIDESIRFYILGLSPNASRISVRFWYTETIGELNRALAAHFNDLSIVRTYDNQPENPGIWQLLLETALLHKSENVNPALAGSVTRSILTGTDYPSSLLAAVITRIRADRDINYYRAALIKAVLTRHARNYSKPQEVSVMLDESSTNTAYRLGRLFAVLEKAQEEAIPGANATIKDRYYGSASATPGVVFPQLLRLSQHHLAKIGGGAKVNKERLIQEIAAEIQSFPDHLSLENQGMFALGYYHQRRALFAKKDSIEVEPQA